MGAFEWAKIVYGILFCMAAPISKNVFHKIFNSIKAGGATLTYPDNTTVIYGDPAQADKLHVRFHTASALRAVVKNPSVGFGEKYASSEITFENGGFDELVYMLDANKQRLAAWFRNPIIYHLGRASTKAVQRKNISAHYDIGNDFYKLWLDKSMTYSCAYFKKSTDTLEQAQAQKVEHILHKLNLKKGMSLLDIGSGWGTLLIAAAQKYGVMGLGITLSSEQLAHSTIAAKKAKVDHLIKFELANYQDLPARNLKFDRIVSVGMFEHVGKVDAPKYFEVVSDLLHEGGVSVLHTISTRDFHGGGDAWIDKYIFPGGYIPAIREINNLLPKYDLTPIDYESLRIHYAMTLDEWHHRYVLHEKTIRKQRGDFFYLTWEMYLASCAANFRAGGIDLSQFILVKGISNKLPLTRKYMYT
ncbi:MAG: SAM-dependent methyltransferase [Candidatus Saccharibacteria bacterium]|nr:SAM-dependent methyltransferase [Candidatus Saccharibacteria bacterium]